MTTTIETTCKACGRTFTPTPEAIRAGQWRVCPACRGQDARKSAPKPDIWEGPGA